MSVTYCSECGQLIHPGDWPWCPHGVSHVAVVPDDLIGGFVQEHFGHTPEYFTSRKAMLERADALNLRIKTPGDSHKGGWALTSKTLEDARALLCRGTQTAEPICETATFTTREIPLTFQVDRCS